MTEHLRIAYIDNLANPDELVLREGYLASTERYMTALGGNNGNLAFVHGARVAMDGPLTRVGWGWTPERVRELADVLVISCANQIGAHADLGPWADAVERFDLPVVLLSLGAQTPNYEAQMVIPDGTHRFLASVDAHRPADHPNIGVRGAFTQDVLAAAGHDSVVLGCPSLFISGDVNLGATLARKSEERTFSRIAIAAGNPFHPKNRLVEPRMIRLVDRFSGAYIVQHPNNIVALALDQEVPPEKLESIAEGLGFASAEECVSWFHRNAYSFHETQTWMHFLRHYDAVMGPRYHGVALGVQAGIPGVVFHIDNRTKELATTTGIPSIGIEDLAHLDLEALALTARWTRETGERFDQNRRRLAADTVDFMQKNRVGVSDHLISLTGSVPN